MGLGLEFWVWDSGFDFGIMALTLDLGFQALGGLTGYLHREREREREREADKQREGIREEYNGGSPRLPLPTAVMYSQTPSGEVAMMKRTSVIFGGSDP